MRRSSALGCLLPAAVVLLAAINVYLYGGNLMKFGKIIPIPRQVLTLDQCMQNPIMARDYIAQEFRDGRMTFEEASRAAARIDDDGTKVALAAMLTEILRKAQAANPPPTSRQPPKNAPSSKQAPGEKKTQKGETKAPSNPAPPPAAKPTAPAKDDILMDADSYARFWVGQMARSTFGILAQRSMIKSGLRVQVYALIFALGLLLYVAGRFVPALRADRQLGLSMSVLSVVFTIVLYTAFLIVFNYSSYQTTGLAPLAVQGRYLFPILVPFYGLMSGCLICWLPRRRVFLQAAIFIAVSAWFLYGDLPYFLSMATPEWFA